jgi:hypothetical protein
MFCRHQISTASLVQKGERKSGSDIRAQRIEAWPPLVDVTVSTKKDDRRQTGQALDKRLRRFWPYLR